MFSAKASQLKSILMCKTSLKVHIQLWILPNSLKKLARKWLSIFLYHCMPLHLSFPMHEQLPLADCVQQNEPDCRKIFSQKSNFIAVEHSIMKEYKLHNFKRQHWELSLSKVWNENAF
jgi:hypothetical protein